MNTTPASANAYIEQEIDERARALEESTQSHVLAFMGDLVGGTDDIARAVVEERKEKGPPRDKLTVHVTTLGGYIEIVQRIVETLRRHYEIVDFVVPNYAYSAGTVLVMSGDAIWMDYYSRLGPIDPQVRIQGGKSVPALGYLEQWKRLLKKASDGEITLPEIQLMIQGQGFDQAELYRYEQARELSISLLKDWLTKYKFKNWEKTEGSGKKVTNQLKRTRAATIARQLNNTKRWHVHGRGISMEVLRRELKLLIDDFGQKPRLNSQIKGYYTLLSDYKSKMQQGGVVHAVGVYRPYIAA